jgi:HD superfamily phosphohydrolase
VGSPQGESVFGLSEFQAFAERFAAAHLDDYVEQLQRSQRTPQPKEVNDALWGTISLTSAEVALLDSPLLQRLRYIRQLGVVHWVYPGAIHTRFEHSLGVLFQVRHITSALNNLVAARQDQPSLIDANYSQLLRLCALLHDIGHAAFSHVSEMGMEAVQAIAPLGHEFSTALRVEARHLSEMFAYYVVASPAMLRLIELMIDRSWLTVRFASNRDLNVRTTIEKLANAIIGKKIDDRVPLMHELISGPFDADKLDYFMRDAQLAGTPSVLDISRLVQKLTVRALEANELPKEIGQHVVRQDRHWLIGVKWSGVAVLDELHLARVLLFAKIYRHPKVVAIEQMLRAVVLTLSHVVPPSKLVEFLYTYPDDALVWMTEESLRATLGLSGAESDSRVDGRLKWAAQTLKDLRERRLWQRALQIHSRYPADPREKDSQQKEGLIEFLEEVEHPQNRVAFVSEMLDEVKRIHDLLNPEPPVDRTWLESQVMLHTMGSTPGGTQIGRAYLLPSNGDPVPFREYMVNRTAWAESYLTDQPRGYVFAAPAFADYVYIAVEKLVRTRFKVRLPASAREASKRDPLKIEALKRQLAAVHYYRDAPTDIRPEPNRLQRADVAGIIDRFCGLRQAYLSPAQQAAANSTPVTPKEQIMLWLRQFDNDDHVDCALRLLEKFRMLTRDDTAAAVRSFINANPQFKGATVVPLGNARDSGALQTYFTADLLGTHVGRCVSLEEAMREADTSSVIFIDDFVASGGQAQDILGAWFGQQELRLPLNENRGMFDDHSLARYLQDRPVAFVFVAAWEDGMRVVSEALATVKLQAVVYRHLAEADLPFMHEALAGVDPRVREGFIERCREIGQHLLASIAQAESKPVDQAKNKQRALGYGNRGMLLSSPFNVPSQTLTAVWARGIVNGVDWEPLLARRKKV